MTFAMLGHIVFCIKSATSCDIQNRYVIIHIVVSLGLDTARRTTSYIMQILITPIST